MIRIASMFVLCVLMIMLIPSSSLGELPESGIFLENNAYGLRHPRALDRKTE